jgi:hypothetical protein
MEIIVDRERKHAQFILVEDDAWSQRIHILNEGNITCMAAILDMRQSEG